MTTMADSIAAYELGAKEFAGFVACKIDQALEDGLSLRDQEILVQLRKQVELEVTRRYPGFDLDQEAYRHQSTVP